MSNLIIAPGVPQTPQAPQAFDGPDAPNTAPIIQNTAREAQQEAQSPPPVPHELANARTRLQTMMNDATVRAGGLQGVNGKTLDEIKSMTTRPSFGHKGYLIHANMLTAAKKCDAATRELNAVPMQEFTRSPISDKAFNALKKFTEAQNALQTQIHEFQTKTGVSNPRLDALAQTSQLRIAEALNFAASMQLVHTQYGGAPSMAAQQPLNLPESVAKGMQVTAQVMHGSDSIIKNLEGEALALFDKLDAVNAQHGLLSLTDFNARIAELRNEMTVLQNKVNQAISPPVAGEVPVGGDSEQNVTVLADTSLFAPMQGMLDRASQRLQDLADVNPRRTVQATLEAIMPKMTTDYSRLERSLPKGFAQELRIVMANYNDNVDKAMRELAQDKPIHAASPKLQTALQEAHGALQTESAKFVIATLRTAEWVKEQADLGISPSRADIERHFQALCPGRRVPDKIITTLEYSDVLLADLVKDFEGAGVKARPSRRMAEIGECCSMFSRIEAAPFARAEFIQQAIEHNVDMGTVLESSLRGISIDQLELQVSDSILIDSHTLGQGAANEVFRCVYRGPDGENQTLVFKPEVNARRGLDNLTVGTLGYDPTVRVMQLNIASTRVADAIGAGDTVARSKLGCFKGQFGLFMEAAPGKTAGDILEGKKFCTLPDGRKVNMAQAISYMRDHGTINAMRANLMRELSNLEWADGLSGQCDRHPQNYLLDINPATGAVKVTGIDNDASFSADKVGLTSFKLSHGKSGESLVLQHLRLRHDATVDLTTAAPTDYEMFVFRQGLGLNQLFKPQIIDQGAYDKLMAINEVEYRASLAPLMDTLAVNAAMSRLADAKSHAQTLMAAGRVITDWTDPAVLQTLKDTSVGKPRSYTEYLGNGFFQRDFLGRFGDSLR